MELVDLVIFKTHTEGGRSHHEFSIPIFLFSLSTFFSFSPFIYVPFYAISSSNKFHRVFDCENRRWRIVSFFQKAISSAHVVVRVWVPLNNGTSMHVWIVRSFSGHTAVDYDQHYLLATTVSLRIWSPVPGRIELSLRQFNSYHPCRRSRDRTDQSFRLKKRVCRWLTKFVRWRIYG